MLKFWAYNTSHGQKSGVHTNLSEKQKFRVQWCSNLQILFGLNLSNLVKKGLQSVRFCTSNLSKSNSREHAIQEHLKFVSRFQIDFLFLWIFRSHCFFLELIQSDFFVTKRFAAKFGVTFLVSFKKWPVVMKLFSLYSNLSTFCLCICNTLFSTGVFILMDFARVLPCFWAVFVLFRSFILEIGLQRRPATLESLWSSLEHFEVGLEQVWNSVIKLWNSHWSSNIKRFWDHLDSIEFERILLDPLVFFVL